MVWTFFGRGGGNLGKSSVLIHPAASLTTDVTIHSALLAFRRWQLNQAMNVFRKYMLLQWKRNLLREFLQYFHQTFEGWNCYRQNLPYKDMLTNWHSTGRLLYSKAWHHRLCITTNDWMKGADSLIRALKCSWWEWDDGSAPFYWRWPGWYQHFIRDGIAFPLRCVPPAYMVPQQDIRNSQQKHLVVQKLQKVVNRRYIGKGNIKSLTSFFSVLKGANDICMVYNGTINGFNDCIEVPRFGMPTLKSHLRAMMPGYYMMDRDVGECFF